MTNIFLGRISAWVKETAFFYIIYNRRNLNWKWTFISSEPSLFLVSRKSENLIYNIVTKLIGITHALKLTFHRLYTIMQQGWRLDSALSVPQIWFFPVNTCSYKHHVPTNLLIITHVMVECWVFKKINCQIYPNFSIEMLRKQMFTTSSALEKYKLRNVNKRIRFLYYAGYIQALMRLKVMC